MDVSPGSYVNHEPTCLAQLPLIRRSLGHRDGNAVRGEEEQRPIAPLGRHFVPSRGDAIGRRLDEARMIVEQPQFVDLRRGGADRLPGELDVVEILPAAGIGAERRGDKGQGPFDAVFGHLADGLVEHRMPVAVAPVDRQPRPIGV